jgi:hypothetical protein
MSGINNKQSISMANKKSFTFTREGFSGLLG